MKKSLLALAICLPLSASVLASNTITFLGEVSSTTCDITVNGSDGDLSVQLSTVATSDLDTAGATAGERDFQFKVSGCTGPASTVGIRLVAPFVDTTGTLKNIATTTPASNVTIQILEGVAPINFTSSEYHSAQQTATGTLTFPFKARYYATGAAQSGTVEAKLEYALSYN